MNDLYVISAVGKDKPGLVHSLSRVMAENGINIVDVDARSVRGHFSMFLVVDLATSTLSYEQMTVALQRIRDDFNLGVQAEKYEAGRRKIRKKLMILTLMGVDRTGLVASISGFLSAEAINIEKIRMIARGEYIAMELKIDTADVDDIKALRKRLYAHAQEIRLDMSLRDYDHFSKPRRVIVFDCDSTLIQQEIIDELAKVAGVQRSVEKLTREAMEGKIDFQQALVHRVGLLKGLSGEQLQALIESIALTPGAEELITALKHMGYKVGVISGGFTFFTEYLKERLRIDYVYANELEIEDGVVTGRIRGKVIDAERKGEILQEIAAAENVSTDQIVAVGDGFNDRFMLSNAGLAIGFNPKELLKDYSDGIISSKNISGLLYFLGVPESYVESINGKKPAAD